MDEKWTSPVPPGQARTEASPPTLMSSLLATAVTTTAIAAITVALRLFTRFNITQTSINFDDSLVVVALVFSFALSGIVVKQIDSGLSYHMWDILWETYNIWNPLYTICATILYALSISFSKLSILCLYLRLSPQAWFRRVVYALVGVVVCYSIVYVFINIFGCRPTRASWDLSIPESDKTCINKLTTYMVLSIANIVMDVCILLLPLPIVLPLQMAQKQKCSLILLFGTGAFVCGVAIKRTIMLPQLLSSDDYCWDAVEQFIWCFLEVNAGIVCASVPALKPFFMRYLPSLIMAQLSSNNSTPTTGKTSRSRGLDTVVAQNLERRRIQDESYMLSSRDERSISDVKRGFEEDDETKLWDGHQKNPTPRQGPMVLGRDLAILFLSLPIDPRTDIQKTLLVS